MKYKIEINSSQDEDLIICAKEHTPTLERLEAMLAELDKSIIGYDGGATIKLNPQQIHCFFIEDTKTYAMTERKRLQVKERMYKIEEAFPENFVKINQSCLINVSKIARFDSSIGGALLVTLENGYKDYVSRRQLKSVKKRMGI